MIITGESTSRLSELRKYTITNVFSNQYFTGGTINNNGIDVNGSNPLTQIVYYLDGIKYVDIISGSTIYSGYTSGTTLNMFTPQGVTTDNFIDVPCFKNPNKDGIISNPKINDDVFISRQEISAFESNYRLEYIRNMNDLLTYAGGNLFNIVNNT